MKRRHHSVGLLLLFIAFSASNSTELARAQSIYGQTDDRIVSAKLVSTGVGWAALMRDANCAPGNVFPPCPPMRLYLTDDNGQHWRNTTPPDMPTRNIRQVFFLDRSHGWVLSTDALGDESNAPFFLFSTEDGGNTWRTLVLRRPMFNLMDDYTFPSQLFFSDSQHGWMLWRWGVGNSLLSYLLATTDGGRTWKRLSDPPLGTSLQFTSPRDGWMIGTAKEDWGIPIPENDAVWSTHDGGQHWQEIVIPLPAKSKSEKLYFSTLKFVNRREGAVAAEKQLSNSYQSFVWVTHDAGRTWRVSTVRWPAQSASLAGSQVVLAFHDPASPDLEDLRIRKNGRTITPELPRDLPSGISLGYVDLAGHGYLDFVDSANAWMNVYSALLATTDGGKSFQMILPSSGEPEWEPPPQIIAVNGIRQVGMQRVPENLPSSVAAKLMVIHGTGFLPENSVWFGADQLQVVSEDGETLRFKVPQHLATGTYNVRLENAHGRSDPVEVLICAVGPPRILEAHRGLVNFSGDHVVYRGLSLSLRGCGFLEKTGFGSGVKLLRDD